jgi:hypothetical protein
MYARVVRFEGADAESLEETASRIRSESDAGPPPGVPAKEFLLLNDKENGRSLAVMLFESEDDYNQGDQTLNSMDPPGPGMGQRIAVEKYEVGAQLQV